MHIRQTLRHVQCNGPRNVHIRQTYTMQLAAQYAHQTDMYSAMGHAMCTSDMYSAMGRAICTSGRHVQCNGPRNVHIRQTCTVQLAAQCAHQTCTVQLATPWLTLLPQQSGFSPRLRHSRLEMDRLALGEGFLIVLVLSIVTIIPPLLRIGLYELNRLTASFSSPPVTNCWHNRLHWSTSLSSLSKRWVSSGPNKEM